MKKGGGKGKGSGFENKIAKDLSEYLDPLKFRRSQQSGAIVGGMNEKLIENFAFEALRLFVGDVVPTNEAEESIPNFRFSIECKFYKDGDSLKTMLGSSAKVYGWMEEAKTDAAKLNIEPLLIFKFNHTPIFAGVDKNTDLPDDVDFMVLTTGDKVCLYDDLKNDKNWWYR